MNGKDVAPETKTHHFPLTPQPLITLPRISQLTGLKDHIAADMLLKAATRENEPLWLTVSRHRLFWRHATVDPTEGEQGQ